jgi:hypothetical protein
MPDITELDSTAQLLRISWRKMHNYAASFITTWYGTKKRFDAGEFPGWTFGMWSGRNAGLGEDGVHMVIAPLKRAIASEYRDQIRADEVRRKHERDAEREQKRREVAERKAARQAKKQKPVEEHVPPAVAAAHLAAAPLPRKRRGVEDTPGQAALRQPINNSPHHTVNDSIVQKKRRGRNRARLIANPPANDRCAQALANAGAIERRYPSRRTELGKEYWECREEVLSGRAGKDDGARPWTWPHWVEIHITNNPDKLVCQSYEAVMCCIEDYENWVSRTGNVVNLR